MVLRTRLTNPIECDTPATESEDLVRLDQIGESLPISSALYISAENWNNVGGGVDALASTTIAAGAIYAETAWSVLNVMGNGTFAANGNSKMLRFMFAGNPLITTTSTYNDMQWNFSAQLYAILGSLVYIAQFTLSDGTIIQATDAFPVDFTVPITAEWQCTGVDDADIVQNAAALILTRSE